MVRRAGRGRRAERLGGPGHTITGDVRVHREVASRTLGRSRDIFVYLPPCYDLEEDRRYPVLYVHDGQNLFDAATAFAGDEWGLDEAAERSIAAGRLEALIIVGIAHGGERRMDELTPTPDRQRGGGQLAAYGRMLIEEVKPLIDRTYRTRPSREHTALGGSSLGGLATLCLGLERPDVFSRLAVVSPSVWWGGRELLRRVQALPGALPLRIWLDMGTAEGRAALRDVRALRAALAAKGWREGHDLSYHEIEGATHGERAWAARADAILLFLFPRMPH